MYQLKANSIIPCCSQEDRNKIFEVCDLLEIPIYGPTRRGENIDEYINLIFDGNIFVGNSTSLQNIQYSLYKNNVYTVEEMLELLISFLPKINIEKIEDLINSFDNI